MTKPENNRHKVIVIIRIWYIIELRTNRSTIKKYFFFCLLQILKKPALFLKIFSQGGWPPTQPVKIKFRHHPSQNR